MATVGGGLFDNNICSSKSDNGQKIHKNNNNNDNNDNNSCRSLRNSRYNNTWLVASLSIAIWSLLTLTTGIAVVQGAAVYSNLDFLSNPNFEPICSEQQERFIESEGKESSLLLEFNADDSMSSQSKSCKRILSAPSAYGFIVRLILPKIRSSHLLQPLHHGKGKDRGGAEGSEVVGKPFSGKGKSTSSSSSSSSASTSSAMNEMTSLIEKLNSTALKSALGRTCPLSIFSSLDPHTPQWRVDPCQLEDTAPEMEDPVRLFHGRVRIVWEHGHNSLDSKLMVTVLGKGDQCRSETKHQCLKIGDEPILCISKDLICDGIRHCPYSNEYDSDEDYTMCWKRRRFGEPLPAMESDIFEHFALEVFRNLFAFDVPAMPGAPTTTTTTTASPETSKDSSKSSADSSSSSSSASLNSTTLRKVDSKKMASAGGDSGEANATTSTTNVTEGAAGSHRRNSTRLGLNSDLSKYGPWGYLMLGMLLCGGALLICGLWASASQHAANNERESSLAHGGVGSGHNNNSSLDHQSSGAPPNYEELDPPPPYSVLFPNQKAASSTTLSSIGNAAAAAASTTMTTTTALPGDNAANRAANSVEGPATTTTTTRVQLEAAASSSSSISRGGAGAGGSSSSNSATTTHHVTQ